MERLSKNKLSERALTRKKPTLRRLKSRDLAFVDHNGRRFYFGKWNAPETVRRYASFLAKLDAGADPSEPDEREPPTLAELAVEFFEARKNYYVKNGKQTNQLARFKTALEYPLLLYPDLPVDKFGPKKALECRDAMERSGRFARQYINTLVNCLRGVFKFGVERELVRPETLQALQAISPLKRGRSCARERVPIRPVHPDDVEKTLAELSPTVGAMVRVQRYTGMRPGEVCSMRVGDFARDGEVLVYMPRTDKTDWRREIGDFKRIPLGPKAQAVLVPYLMEKEDDRDAYLFSPIDAARDLALERREKIDVLLRQRLARLVDAIAGESLGESVGV
ncbi:MAG: hypothetical protein IJM30_11240 [Thermoguttaceae bacterium]|nr:hypothetical protein [Thermoguttaceae bacterium]